MSRAAFAVRLRNNDTIPYDFVLDVLQHGFLLDQAAASDIALRCHHDGVVEFGELGCEAALHGVRLARACAARRGYLLSLNVVTRQHPPSAR